MRIYDKIISKTLIDKGWSGDRKFCAESAEGELYLLRISPIDRLERKRCEFERMEEVSHLDIPVC